MAWKFDRAVATFGMSVDSDLEAARAKAKTKNQARLKVNTILMGYGLLGGEDGASGYRDPMKG